ncbi:hypothetical protein ACSHWO_10945 [Streptomyces sp. HUAS TT3]|uniref:hypothetical protein n=1 Tax=Streptomyces sp. HUAS TT3 TaxID=3447510 RepID=UPI003F65C09F
MVDELGPLEQREDGQDRETATVANISSVRCAESGSASLSSANPAASGRTTA